MSDIPERIYYYPQDADHGYASCFGLESGPGSIEYIRADSPPIVPDDVATLIRRMSAAWHNRRSLDDDIVKFEVAYKESKVVTSWLDKE